MVQKVVQVLDCVWFLDFNLNMLRLYMIGQGYWDNCFSHVPVSRIPPLCPAKYSIIILLSIRSPCKISEPLLGEMYVTRKKRNKEIKIIPKIVDTMFRCNVKGSARTNLGPTLQPVEKRSWTQEWVIQIQTNSWIIDCAFLAVRC